MSLSSCTIAGGARISDTLLGLEADGRWRASAVFRRRMIGLWPPSFAPVRISNRPVGGCECECCGLLLDPSFEIERQACAAGCGEDFFVCLSCSGRRRGVPCGPAWRAKQEAKRKRFAARPMHPPGLEVVVQAIHAGVQVLYRRHGTAPLG